MAQGTFDQQLNRMPQPPSVPPRLVGLAAIVFFVLITFSTAFYQVEPEEVGVVVRLGEFIDTSEPGLHFKIPFGVDQVYKVQVERQLNQEFGFRTKRADVRSEFTEVPEEASMLTGDLNAAVVEWVVQYRIIDPYNYLFRVRNVEETFRDVAEAVMREVVGDRTVNEVITVGRQDVAATALASMQVLCDQYEMGVVIEQVVLQDVTPPDRVKPAFNEVNQAQQERERLINEAQSEYNKVVPRARGEAEQTVLAAEGYALDRVNRAKGEASRFRSIFDAYQTAPEVTRKRLYLETLDEVVPAAGEVVIVDESVRSFLPLLNLNSGGRGPVAPRTDGGSQ
ncbi:MAG: FtsH protease activity modulator HflK [Acidobacteriota bacterium]